jgi:hypothetical protein
MVILLKLCEALFPWALWNVARCNWLPQYNFSIPLRNLNFIDGNQLHGLPATPAATGPRVRPTSLIFLYKMFFLHAQLRIVARQFRSRPTTIVLAFHQMALSRLVVHAANRSTTLNRQTGSGGSTPKTAYPPLCAPGGVVLKACGQGPPSMRPDGAGVVNVAEGGSFDGTEDDDDEEDVGTSTDRWVSGSGTPGSFCLAYRGPLGFWRRWFLCWGTTGGRCSLPWSSPDPGIFSVPLILGAGPESCPRGFTSRRTHSPSISGNICVS